MEMINHIEPYSPEWWRARIGTFTGSEAWKLMSEPRGKTYAQLYNETIESINDKKAKYRAIKNKATKTAIKTIESIIKLEYYAESLENCKDELQLSETANTYILDKVWEVLSDTCKQGVDNFATQWGIENEPLARKWYSKKTGFDVQDPYLCFSKEVNGLSCTPDNFVNEDGLAEIKCPYNGANHLKHCFITTDEYFKNEHSDYYWQCQTQMFITGRVWCDFVSFDPRINSPLGFFKYRLEANEEDHFLIKKKVSKARELFDGYLISFKGEKIDA